MGVYLVLDKWGASRMLWVKGASSGWLDTEAFFVINYYLFSLFSSFWNNVGFNKSAAIGHHSSGFIWREQFGTVNRAVISSLWCKAGEAGATRKGLEHTAAAREGRTTTSAHVCGRTTAQDGLKRAIKCRGTKFPSKSTRTWKTSENEFHGYTTIYNY
jgi:hypothetical protein